MAARQWIEAAKDRNGKPPRGTEFGVWLSETLDGTWRLDGILAPGDGKLLDEAIQQHLRPMLAARRDGDPSVEPSSVAELKAQALVDIADADLRNDLPAQARNNRHRINLIVQLNDDGSITADGRFPTEAWCDATFIRMVLDAQGEILDVGRATRTWPDAIANAVYTRDRHCRFPGCETAANRCDLHHRTHWQHGGTTSIDNAILLCRRHHRFIHTNHWTIDHDAEHQPVFRQPDGRPYAPPASRRPTVRPARLTKADGRLSAWCTLSFAHRLGPVASRCRFSPTPPGMTRDRRPRGDSRFRDRRPRCGDRPSSLHRYAHVDSSVTTMPSLNVEPGTAATNCCEPSAAAVPDDAESADAAADADDVAGVAASAEPDDELPQLATSNSAAAAPTAGR